VVFFASRASSSLRYDIQLLYPTAKDDDQRGDRRTRRDRRDFYRSASSAGSARSAFDRPPITLASRHDSRGNADGNGPRRDILSHHRGGTDNRTVANRDAVEDLRAGADPGTVADRHAGGSARLLENRPTWVGEIVVAADHVAVRRHQDVCSDA